MRKKEDIKMVLRNVGHDSKIRSLWVTIRTRSKWVKTRLFNLIFKCVKPYT